MTNEGEEMFGPIRVAEAERGDRGKRVRTANETVIRALAYATRDRKTKKREFRALWIVRLNAAARAHGLTYSRFIAACKKANVQLDRKQLSELAVRDQAAFDAVVAQVTAT